MSNGDATPSDAFDSFLESTVKNDADRREFDLRLLELAPAVNSTLRALDIPLFQDTTDEEINANMAMLLINSIEQEKAAHPMDDIKLLRARAQMKASGIVTRQAITLLDIKCLMMEAMDDPLHADEIKQRAIAQRLFNEDFAFEDNWFKAYDILIPGAHFDGNSDAAQAGYSDALQDSMRREKADARRVALAQDIATLFYAVTENTAIVERVVPVIVTQFLSYKLYPSDAEAAIDEVLRETGLQELKPAILLLLEGLNDTSS